jgi:hypothetical protein|tara:strand:+ start:435 stop:1070 length:636 start_codon:yes stop_codon:yes gene_type:complete
MSPSGMDMNMVNDYLSTVQGGGRTEVGVYAEFSLKAKKVSDSGENGLPVYEDREWIEITPAGGNQITPRWATEKDKMRFSRIYEAFKKGVEPPVDGLAIENWPSVTPAETKMLKQANVRTVEDLAVLSETGLKNVGFGARGLQQKARTFLVSAAGDGKVSAELHHLKVKNESLKLRVEELERQNNELRAQFRAEKNIPNNNWETVPEGDTT